MEGRSQPSPHVVRKAEFVCCARLLPLNARARFRVRIAAITPTAAPFQLEEVRLWHPLVVPHQVAVVELEWWCQLVVDMVDDLDVRRVGLVHSGVLAHHGLEDGELHVVAAPREVVHVVDQVLQVVRDVLRELVEVGVLFHDRYSALLPGQEFETIVNFQAHGYLIRRLLSDSDAAVGRRNPRTGLVDNRELGE